MKILLIITIWYYGILGLYELELDFISYSLWWEKLIVLILFPLFMIPLLIWKIQIHKFHKELVSNSKANREWFDGKVLW